MKKVSILSLHLGYGGIEKSIIMLANILSKKYEVEIAVCYKLYDSPVFELNEKVKVKYLNGKLAPNHEQIRNAFKTKNIFKIIKEGLFALKVLHLRKKSIINYINSTSSDVIISTRDIFNNWLSKNGNDNVLKIGWEHNHFHDDIKYANKVVKSAKNLDYFVLVSSELNDYYSMRMSNYKCKCLYIPNSIESIPLKSSKLNEKRFISVGRLSPEKGYLDLIKVFELIRKKGIDWRLDIVGDGVEREKLQKYIDAIKLSNNIKLHGFQGKDYIDELLDSSSIYLMTSYTESFGIVLIEAMSHGVPCIAFSSAEGAREIIEDGKNGFLIENRDFNEMVNACDNLVKNKDIRLEMGKYARESVYRFTSENVGRNWFDLIEKSD